MLCRPNRVRDSLSVKSRSESGDDDGGYEVDRIVINAFYAAVIFRFGAAVELFLGHGAADPAAV